jgi:hypothetical protein
MNSIAFSKEESRLAKETRKIENKRFPTGYKNTGTVAS